MIGTSPTHADGTMHECHELGIKSVWLHRSFGQGSVSDSATQFGRAYGITVIDGGCPLMFEPCSDPGHKAMRVVFTVAGHVPRKV